jgi:hypothetical protein
VEQVIEVNNARKKRMAKKVIDFCGGSVAGLRVCVLGVTFKANTDDMRDAPSLDIVPALMAAGAEIVAFDPEGMTEAEALPVTFAKTAYEAAASRRAGGHHRMARIPWPRSQAPQGGDASAPHRRPAQHLQSRRNAWPGLCLRGDRPSPAAHLDINVSSGVIS